VSRAFTPRRVETFERAARERAASLLAKAVAGHDVVDLVAAVTDDYALLNLADLLGVPESDRTLMLHWTRRVIGYQDPDEGAEAAGGPASGPRVNPRSPSALADMFAYADELTAHKRAHPADDVLTTLAADPELTAPERQMFFFLLTVAGNDTVRGAAPGALALLAGDPIAYQRLRTGQVDPTTATDELLRRHPPVLTFRRTATEDTVLAGTRIARGDKVVVLHASANHDERVWPDPFTLDLARTPNPHVSFGDGPHVCLGAHFARLQLRVLYEEVGRALPELSLAGTPRRLVSNFINGIKELPVHVG
jgi:cytochrome P450